MRILFFVLVLERIYIYLKPITESKINKYTYIVSGEEKKKKTRSLPQSITP